MRAFMVILRQKEKERGKKIMSGGKRANGAAIAKSENLTVLYSNMGSDAIMFINRKTLNNGTEIYSSDNTRVTARIEKVNNGYKATAYRNRDEYDFFRKTE